MIDTPSAREAFSPAVPLKTLVIDCYDPRAAEIPQAVAERLGGEVFPGQVIRDASCNRVASSTTMSPIIVAGGRAIAALRSVTVPQYLFGIQNNVAVHHSHCGATTFTADGIIEPSLKQDTARIRSHAGTPTHVNIFGYFYDIDTGTLTEVVTDKSEAVQQV